MKKESKKEEQTLLAAASSYAKVNGVSLPKMAWALSSVMGMPDNNVLHRLREMTDDIDVDQSLEGLRKRLTDEGEDEVGAMESLESRVGEVVTVEVLSIRTYGAICKVDGTTRTLLLHLSEIADAFIDDISEYVDVGDKFPAMLVVNNKGFLGLSTRRYESLEKKRIAEMYTNFYEEEVKRSGVEG